MDDHKLKTLYLHTYLEKSIYLYTHLSSYLRKLIKGLRNNFCQIGIVSADNIADNFENIAIRQYAL